jgi:general secretion pathway protein G
MKLMKCEPSTRLQIKRQHQRAFTLVEMLLVLAILALLAGLVLPKLVGTQERAKIKATITQIGAFKTSLDLFEVDNGHYPKGRNGLQDLVVKPRDAGSDWHQYMDKVPPDPWQHPYIYECPGRHNPNGFDLSSAGPDGIPGNQDDINNWETGK